MSDNFPKKERFFRNIAFFSGKDSFFDYFLSWFSAVIINYDSF